MNLLLQPYFKNIFYRLHITDLLDAFLYRLQLIKHKKENKEYLQNHPGIALPKDYILYETYQLNYRKFIEDGKLAASEIISWTNPYLTTTTPRILDWGCGAARITRHIFIHKPNASVYGCDTNETIIEWNRNSEINATFSVIDHFTPTLYAPDFFDLVFGFSVLTHIDTGQQIEWIKELHRILDTNGILLITTQGCHYIQKLLPVEKREFSSTGMITKSFRKKGHRLMSTYHDAAIFKQLLTPYFEVLEFQEGSSNQEKAGGQDLWILRKKSIK